MEQRPMASFLSKRSMDSRGVTEMPLQLIIIGIVAAISIGAIIVGLYYYSVSSTNANMEGVASEIMSAITNIYGETNTDTTLDVTINGVGMVDVDYFMIGDTLLNQEDRAGDSEWMGYNMKWQVAGGDTVGRDIRSDQGNAILVTSTGKDVGENDGSWPNPLTSGDNWGFTMKLLEGSYKLKIRARNWDGLDSGENTEPFVLIYDVD